MTTPSTTNPGDSDEFDTPRFHARLQQTFGSVVLSLMAHARYRHVPLGDIAALVLEPLLRDRVAIASLGSAGAPATVGVAIWASVDCDADERIRTQIGAGVWPVRLKPEDWTSGESLWLLDVAAPSRLHASAVLIGFGKVAGDRSVNVHPVVAKSVDPELLASLLAEGMKR